MLEKFAGDAHLQIAIRAGVDETVTRNIELKHALLVPHMELILILVSALCKMDTKFELAGYDVMLL